MKQIVIERGKQIPPPGKPGRRRIYPFDKMSVGESFHVPGVSYQSVSSSVKWFTSHQPGKRWVFRIRKQTVDGAEGISVFRIE